MGRRDPPTKSKRPTGEEEDAQIERTLLRTIIDAVPHLIYVKDNEGRFTLVNKAWRDARGLTLDEVQGKAVADFFPPALAAEMEAQDQTVLSSGTPLVDVEQRMIHRAPVEGAHKVRWALTTKVPLRSAAGDIIGVVGISRDITVRRRLERERAMEHVVTRVLSESRSVEETMALLLRTICEAMDWAYGARWEWDADRRVLCRAEWWCAFEPHFDPEDAARWVERASPRSGGLVGSAWIDGHAACLSDVAAEPHFARKASCEKLGFRSALAFPIDAHGQRYGVMEFFGREVLEPDAALVELMGAISGQIGQFIRRKQAEESLQESEQQLRAMFENADVGIAVTDLDMRYLRVNDKFCTIVGYDRDELLRLRVADVNLEPNVGAVQEQRERMMSERAAGKTVEKQLVRKDGTLVWVSVASSLVRASDGTPRYFIAVIQDISESKRASEALKQSEEQFRRLAQYDTLTALPNRALFYDRLGHALAAARRNRWTLAVLFIDVDNFKHVNDTFGHAAGDLLLKHVSSRLSGCVRSEDTVGRLGGDEFAIVLGRLAAPEVTATVAQKIVEDFSRPFQLEGAELFVSASIGITVYPTDSADQDTLIRNADIAMYRAKDAGRNNYQFYTPEMNRPSRS